MSSTIAPSAMSTATSGSGTTNINSNAAQFREIHKNTWLKRLTAEGKKITVGPKKSERSWVVFCVHDDTEALLEGYAEPRQAPCHFPEWVVPLQHTLHISHALIPNSHEFEFVVTTNEVVRFHAMSWEIMQEWVETLRSKLREMKILSPRENLYTKLPEIRAPLLPTRDPTSPLPAPPPVPAALVPGVERVVTHSSVTETTASTDNTIGTTVTTTVEATATLTTTTTTAAVQTAQTTRSVLTAMSNTLTQNLLNMLSDPINAYSEQLNGEAATSSNAAMTIADAGIADTLTEEDVTCDTASKVALLRSKSNSTTDNSVRVDISGACGNRSSADTITMLGNMLQCEPLIPRPQTSRSLSAGAADKAGRKQQSSNVTEMEISTNTNAHENDDAAAKTNITIIQVSTTTTNNNNNNGTDDATPEAQAPPPPLLPAKTITGEVFKFPEQLNNSAPPTKAGKQEYKSNVQIIPSNANSSTIQVLSHHNSPSAAAAATTAIASAAAIANQYSTPVKKSTAATDAGINNNIDSHKLTTTVHVAAASNISAGSTATASVYGTCYGGDRAPAVSAEPPAGLGTPKLPKKIILSANTSGITNIAVNNAPACSSAAAANEMLISVKRNAAEATTKTDCNINVHYETVFLASSIPIAATASQMHSTTSISTRNTPQHKDLSARHQTAASCLAASVSQHSYGPISLPSSPALGGNKSTDSHGSSESKSSETQKSTVSIQLAQQPQSTTRHHRNKSNPSPIAGRRGMDLVPLGSPAVARRRIASPVVNMPRTTGAAGQSHSPSRPTGLLRAPLLTRGLTEAVITSRPSRRDFHFLSKFSSTATAKTKGNGPISGNTGSRGAITLTSNNNDELPSTSTVGVALPAAAPLHHVALDRANSESLEQRRRSSSTSDAQNAARGNSGRASNTNANNNDLVVGRQGVGALNNCALRIQQPPQPFRSVENGTGCGVLAASGISSSPGSKATSPAAKRITLREQQVLQLRREIMHPGGVRLQLRRKDCVGSIAWVDAFGAVWVAGWKQKEHPVLYNALHIGDQLLSIAGVAVNSSLEANKIIRNANTLFVEVLVRRLPFGRGYAIRREREGQCLGLIRDGNTATIVDVVPNSLAARHGLPPKAQSCDGTTLTFWVLTEINGRPLNLFFKEYEIRDRLNSVGRDMSILVQPADLITKLKKQLKSLRGYKDYLVQ